VVTAGSWVFSKVSTCSMNENCISLAVPNTHAGSYERISSRTLTQSLFQGFDVTPFGTRLPSNLIIRATMAQSCTCGALGLDPSHFSFLFLQIMQAILFGFGTLLSPPLAASPPFAHTWASISFVPSIVPSRS